MHHGNTPATDLRNAALVIEQVPGGWTRNTAVHPQTGGVCAMGALVLACGAGLTHNGHVFQLGSLGTSLGATQRYEEAHHALQAELRIIHGRTAVPYWNDEVAADAHAVVYTMRRAAERWEREHVTRAAERLVGDGPRIRYSHEVKFTYDELITAVEPKQKDLALASGPVA